MNYSIVFAPDARQDFRRLPADNRAAVRDAVDKHLAQAPTRVSKSRIKRLRDMAEPQYRLRVGDLRVFHDVVGSEVQVIGVVGKAYAAEWLRRKGVRE